MDIGGWINGAIANTWNIASGIGSFIQQKKNLNKQLTFQREENEKAREYNLNLAKQQNQWNIEQEDRAREYNLPKNEMARIQAAGLNPDLYYGSGATGTAAVAPQMTSGAPTPVQDFSAVGSQRTIGDFVAQAANAAQSAANVNLTNAQADKARSEARGQDITNESLADMLSSGIAKNEADVKNALASAGVSGKQLDLMSAQISQIYQGIETSKATIQGIQAEISNKSVQQAQNWFKLSLEKSLNNASIQRMASEVGVNAATIRKMAALLPAEFANLMASAASGQSSANLNMARTATELYVRAQYGANTKKANAEAARINQTVLKEGLPLESMQSSDGSMSTVGKAIYLLGEIMKNVSPFGK